MYPSTGDAGIKARDDQIVRGLAQCQEHLGPSGDVRAFPISLFDRLDALKEVWASFYTIHKIARPCKGFQLNDTIYSDDNGRIYVNFHAASGLNWKARGIRLKQATQFPLEPRTSIVIHESAADPWRCM